MTKSDCISWLKCQQKRKLGFSIWHGVSKRAMKQKKIRGRHRVEFIDNIHSS